MSVDEKAVLELYNKKLSDHRIAKELRIKRWKVQNIRVKHNLPAHYKWGYDKIVFNEDQKILIFELHARGKPIMHIANELGVSEIVIKNYCKNKGLDTSAVRGKAYLGHLRNEKIFKYLEQNGPTPLKLLLKKVEINRSQIPEFLRTFYDEIEAIEFKVGRRGAIKYGATELYTPLLVNQKIISLRNDPRLIDFVADNIIFEIKNRIDASTLMKHMSKGLDKERCRLIIEKLGYEYIT